MTDLTAMPVDDDALEILASTKSELARLRAQLEAESDAQHALRALNAELVAALTRLSEAEYAYRLDTGEVTAREIDSALRHSAVVLAKAQEAK